VKYPFQKTKFFCIITEQEIIKGFKPMEVIMTNASVKNTLKNMLFKRYNKLLLNQDEVEKEVQENTKNVATTSVIPNTWLIDDVVNYLTGMYDTKKKGSTKEHKEKIIQDMNKNLKKYWKSASYDLGELELQGMAA
jgi:hypothetical protein